MTTETKETLAAIVQQAADKLGEHFDSVLILCSKYDEGETHRIQRGVGNLYAQHGHAEEWLIRQKALTDEEARRTIDDDKQQ